MNYGVILILIRLVLGMLFLLSGMSKITGVESFAVAVYIIGFADWLTQSVLYSIPVLEVLIGASLLSGYRVHSTLDVALIMMIVFTLFLIVKHDVALDNCGCFGDLWRVSYGYEGIVKNLLVIGGLITLYIGTVMNISTRTKQRRS